VDELLVLAVALDQQLAVEDRDLEVAGRERADEDDLLRVLADVDEAAGASKPWAEPRHVEVALLVGLRETEEGRVEAGAAVVVARIGHVEDPLGIGPRAEVHAPGRDAADDAGLGG